MNTLTAVSLIYAQGFQFPSNGKAYPKPLPNFPTPRFFTLCFNSLQTGKRIQSCNSNIMVIRMRHTVSIPFKRESVSKEDSALFHSVLKVQGFNSLQTGKRIQRHSLKDSGRSVSDCVSIPFKRESVSKGEKLKKVLKATATLKFQFPSNGKAYPKIATARSIRLTIALTVVSIPFKRESVSKVKSRIKYQKPKKAVVSIPFKRESVSKVILQPPLFQWLYTRFNSLQTGKRIQRRLTMSAFSSDLFKVSIPFKRESVSKVTKRENLL